MSVYETQYHSEPSSQNYPIDQYGTTNDSNSSSPRAESNSIKPQDDFPTPTTDVSNEGDDSCSPLNYQYNNNNFNMNDPSKYLKIGESNQIVYNGKPLNQYVNQNDNLINYNGENVFIQSYSVANFDPNFVPGNFVSKNTTEQKTYLNDPESEKKILNSKSAVKNDIFDIKTPSFLMQPPDSDSIEAATANAKRKRPQRRSRTKFEKEQIDLLEATFLKTHYPDVNLIDRISRTCNLTTERISVWFQNRRARFKRSKKGCKEELEVPNHNPLLEELGLLNSEADSFTPDKRAKKVNQSDRNDKSYNENESDDEKTETKPIESQKIIQNKPIFNPITLPHSSSNQNLTQIYHPQINKYESYYSQNDSNIQTLTLPIKKSVQDDQNEDQNSLAPSSSSSRNSSPKPDSDSSSELPELKNLNNFYHSYPINQMHYGNLPPHLLNMPSYQTGFNNNFYMPHIQQYAQNLPSLFQPYFDYNKTELTNVGYFNNLNPQALQGYYGNV